MARRRPRTRRGLPAAIGLGLAGGMRTFIPPATIALRDRRPRSGLVRRTILLASVGELAADKYAKTPSRTEPPGLGARFAASGSVGWICAGPIGGVLAGATAVGSAFLMHGVRGGLGDRTGLPDPVFGAVEDCLAIAIARAVTRRPLDARPPAVDTTVAPRPPDPTPKRPATGRKAARAASAEASRAARARARRPRRRPCRFCRRSRR